MPFQLNDARFAGALLDAVRAMGGRCALAGVVGAQVHVARKIGLDKVGPPAAAIEVVPLGGVAPPPSALGIPVVAVDALGFEGSIEAGLEHVDLGFGSLPVASAEHVIGLSLAARVLPTHAKWADFVLMRVCGDDLDLEEVRGFLKRCPDPDRQTLLAELAYLAA